ncbi:MAG: MSCRAMM family protein [Streptosporangiales bacterium]
MEQRPEPWTAADPASSTGNGTPGDHHPVVVGTVTRADRRPVAHAPLTLTTLHGEQVDRAVSDQTGSYRLHPPAAGSYIVICVAGDHQPRASLVTVADQSVRHDVELAGTGSVSGMVRLGGTVSDASGVVVTVTDGSGTVVAAATTDALGGYAFGDLAEGTYTLTAASMEHEPVALAVTVPGGGRVERDIDLAGRCRLTGTVRASSDGRPVHEALVTVIDGTGSVVSTTPTSEAGTFAFDNLPEGHYTLATAGYAPVATQVHLAAGATNSSDVILTSPSP